MKAFKIIVAVVLALHGLVHLMGTATYLKLAEVQGLPYKTTVLAGHWDLGEVGVVVFGVLWAVVAIGFIVTPMAWLTNKTWWRPALLIVTLLSLVLTLIDWKVAKAGSIVNLVILAVLWVSPLFKVKTPSLENAVRR